MMFTSWIKRCGKTLIDNAEMYGKDSDITECIKIKIEIWKGQTPKIIIEQYGRYTENDR